MMDTNAAERTSSAQKTREKTIEKAKALIHALKTIDNENDLAEYIRKANKPGGIPDMLSTSRDSRYSPREVPSPAVRCLVFDSRNLSHSCRIPRVHPRPGHDPNCFSVAPKNGLGDRTVGWCAHPSWPLAILSGVHTLVGQIVLSSSCEWFLGHHPAASAA